MVDLVEIQAAYYMVAATGVLVAAIYYAMNLRENRRNGRITLTSNLMQMFQTPESLRHLIEFMHMEWTDYEDFEKKYGTENNIESASVRTSMWCNYNTLGELLKKGIVDEDTIYSTLGWNIASLWKIFEPIIGEHRRRYMSRDQWTGFEYLGGRMIARLKEVDPDYKIPDTYDKFIPNK
jgi:hypothetical protein